MATTEIVYKNRDNPNVVTFYEDYVAMDFTSTTRVVLKLYNSNRVLQATVDSNSSPSLISWSGSDITFNLNDLVLNSAIYQAQVIVYDSSHPDGQVIAHPRSVDDLLSFEFVNA